MDNIEEVKSIFDNITIRNPDIAFENAIKKGLKPNEYMYMNSDKKYDYFKHSVTRAYVRYRISKKSLLEAPLMTIAEYRKHDDLSFSL